MVAIKASEVDAFIARPDPARPVVLVFGPDAGLVSERVNALIKASVDDVNDPFALARLESDDLAAEPSRLVEEAQTIPLFGGRRAVWVKAGGRNIAPSVEPLLAIRGSECRVVIEAGNLPRNAPLRALIERAKNAAALPCYADDEKARERLIDQEMREAGLTLAPDARALLLPLLGGDRAASRSEISQARIVRARTGSGRRRRHRRGRVGRIGAGARRHCGRGLCGPDSGARGPAGQGAHRRNIARLDLLRRPAPAGAAAQMAHGDRSRYRFLDRHGAAAGAVSPQELVEAALKLWNAARLAVAMADLAGAVLQSRRTNELDQTIADRALLAIAVNARRSAA